MVVSSRRRSRCDLSSSISLSNRSRCWVRGNSSLLYCFLILSKRVVRLRPRLAPVPSGFGSLVL